MEKLNVQNVNSVTIEVKHELFRYLASIIYKYEEIVDDATHKIKRGWLK